MLNTLPIVDPSEPQQIGSGSFASIYVVRGQLFVYKVVHDEDRTNELRTEFVVLQGLYASCNLDSFFAITPTIGYHNPSTGEVLSSPSSTSNGPPIVTKGFFSPLTTTHASFAMHRAHVLPLTIGDHIRLKYYPEQVRTTIGPPLLCRLYFGKTCKPHSRFVNPVNFPIDVDRYNYLLDQNSISRPSYPALQWIRPSISPMPSTTLWRGDK